MIENRRQRTRSHGTLNGVHDPPCNPLFLRILERLAKLTEHKRSTQPDQRRKLLKSMERETGIEPATNSLEGRLAVYLIQSFSIHLWNLRGQKTINLAYPPSL